MGYACVLQRLCTPRGPRARQRSSPSAAAAVPPSGTIMSCNTRSCSSSPAREQRRRHKERGSGTATCLVSLLPIPRPAVMIATLRRRSAVWCRGWHRRPRPCFFWAVPSGWSSHSLPAEQLPRNSLVVVTKHQNTFKKDKEACCSGPAPAKRRRSTTRHCINDWMINKSKKNAIQNYRKIPHKTRHCIKDWMTIKGKTRTQNCRTRPHKSRRAHERQTT